MLRSIGSVAFLALLMVGGGNSGSPPPPPPPAAYTVGGTVSGLVGSGLTVAICTPAAHPARGQPTSTCDTGLQVSANGAFTLGSTYPARYSRGDYVAILQQPSSPGQNCVIVNASGSVPSVSVQSLSNASVTVSCPGEYAYVANAADNTFSSYRGDVTTGALVLIGTPAATGASPHVIVGYDYYDGPALKSVAARRCAAVNSCSDRRVSYSKSARS